MPPKTPSIQLTNLEITVRRSSRRKTLALQVKDGRIVVLAPIKMDLKLIQSFVKQKQDWLKKHLERQQNIQHQIWQDGTTFSFLGEEVSICVRPNIQQTERIGQKLHVVGQDLAEEVRLWATEEVKATYLALAQNAAAALNVGHLLRSVKVTNTRSRWGSCNSKGDIRLHWALCLAPLPVLQYVVLHEVAHLLEMNHSPRYWANVARVMPEHQQYRDWLRVHGAGLMAEL